MSKIESPLGNKEYEDSPAKSFVVTDESNGSEGMDVPEQQPRQVHPSTNEVNSSSGLELEKRVREAHQNKQEALKNISPAAKKRIEIIASLGRANKDIVVDAVTFSLRTLKSSEMRQILSATAAQEVYSEQIYEARARTLAYALYEIDHRDIAIVIGADTIEAKVAFIQEMDEQLVQYLYDEYTSLVNTNKKKYSSPEQETKEVVEDLKKSS